jgi:hypothetical protein
MNDEFHGELVVGWLLLFAILEVLGLLILLRSF